MLVLEGGRGEVRGVLGRGWIRRRGLDWRGRGGIWVMERGVELVGEGILKGRVMMPWTLI